MWVDYRVVFEVENMERGIERPPKQALVTLVLEFNDVFFVYF